MGKQNKQRENKKSDELGIYEMQKNYTKVNHVLRKIIENNVSIKQELDALR